VGLRGQFALQFSMNLNRQSPDEGRCTFSMQAEAARVNRLGRLFDELRSHASGWFRWSPADDDFHVDGSHEAA
jgi:hypothetical protein